MDPITAALNCASELLKLLQTSAGQTLLTDEINIAKSIMTWFQGHINNNPKLQVPPTKS